MGLDIYLYDGEERIEEKSERHPDHYGGKGYLRSSYNSAGFNSVIAKLFKKDLYSVIRPLEPEDTSDDSWMVPYTKAHLTEALVRARELTEELKARLKYGIQSVSTMSLFGTMKTKPTQVFSEETCIRLFTDLQLLGLNASDGFSGLEGVQLFQENPLVIQGFVYGVDSDGSNAVHAITGEIGKETVLTTRVLEKIIQEGEESERRTVTAEKALEIYEAERRPIREGTVGKMNYSNGKGDFFFDEPLEVLAIVPGTDTFERPVIHYVYEMEQGTIDHYVALAEVVEEFLETALRLDDPRIGWSS